VSGQLLTGAPLQLPVPRQTALIGVVMFVQGVAFDPPANPLGFVSSDFVRVVVTR
jgi:hypothetical protein